MVFELHFGPVMGIAVSSIGDQFASCSSDKSIRLYRQTQEQVFVTLETREKEERANLQET